MQGNTRIPSGILDAGFLIQFIWINCENYQKSEIY